MKIETNQSWSNFLKMYLILALKLEAMLDAKVLEIISNVSIRQGNIR